MVGGASEFLPVSRSAHLAWMNSLLGIGAEGGASEVALRLGALVAVLVFLRRELRDITFALFAGGSARAERHRLEAAAEGRPDSRMARFVIVGTLPAAVLGLALHDRVGMRISNPIVIAALIFVTGEILWLTRRQGFLRPERGIELRDSFWIGLAQAAALLPGISRCGATISAGLLRDVNGERAARFGFLLSAPVILGAAAPGGEGNLRLARKRDAALADRGVPECRCCGISCAASADADHPARAAVRLCVLLLGRRHGRLRRISGPLPRRGTGEIRAVVDSLRTRG